MPSIVYGGVRYIQIRHAIMCKQCLQTVESKHLHDFKFCACGAVGIDGGIEAGNRILGDLSDMEVRSLYCAFVNKKRIWLPLAAIEEHFREIGRNRRSYDMEKIEDSVLPIRDSTTRQSINCQVSQDEHTKEV